MVPEIITGQRRPLASKMLDGEQRRLGVQRVEDGFDSRMSAPPSVRPRMASM
jgi:hypothetical protein